MMRKIMAVLSALCVLFSSAALAEDLSAMTDEELRELYQSVLYEMTLRDLPPEPAEDAETESVNKRVIEFFSFWNRNDYDEMLAMCDFGWKTSVDDPRAELFRILANGTPLSAQIESVNRITGESPEGLTYYSVTILSYMDRNNGTDPKQLRFSFTVTKEEDGLCYINPAGFETWEEAEEENSPSETGESGSLCFTTFREAILTMNEGDAYTLSDGYAVAVINRNGRLFRVVAPFDEPAEDLYAAYLEDGDCTNDAFQALSEYVKVLPVQYTEELTVIPFTQEELDAMAGKSIREVMSEPWELKMSNYPENPEAGKDIVFPMVKGFCKYELVINESFDDYQKLRGNDRYDPITIMSLRNYLDLTVRCVRYSGISAFNTADLCYQADGTIQRDIEPFPEDYDYDLMDEIADYLNDLWKNEKPDQETKEAIIAKLTEEHPEAEEMIRQIVGSFH